MKKLTLTTTLIFCIAMACFAAFAGFAGKWQANIKLPDGNVYPIAYDFQVSGGKLTGTATAKGPAKTINDGKVNGNKISFSITDDDGKAITHEGKYYAEGDSISMDINYQGTMLHGTLTRVKADK